MKVSYNEGLATHISPESCGERSNALAEALAGESTGGLLSSENTFFRVPTSWSGREGKIRDGENGESSCDPAESNNLACAEASYARIGRSGEFPLLEDWSRKGGAHTLDVYATRKSDSNIVPERQANKVTLSLRSLGREGR